MPDWRHYKYPVFTVCFVLAVLLLSEYSVLKRWNNLFYDVVLSHNTADFNDDILLVAIDDASVSHFGRWPWGRNHHANLIDILSESGAKVIAFDILFTDPDPQFPEYDDKLARAIANSQRVVLPIHLEQHRLEGQLIEKLPLPQIAAAVAAMGHIHVELDSDGLARSVFLKAGLGEAVWSSFPLAIASLHNQLQIDELSYSVEDGQADFSPYVWVQDYPVRFPFAGPPGSFKRISYVDVLNAKFPTAVFKDKYVLIGITASGSTDRFPTPVSQTSQMMPGIELFANLLSSLLMADTIRDIRNPYKTILVILPVILLMIAMPRLLPMASAIATIVSAAGCLFVSYLLLIGLNLWISPVTTTLAILVSYPAWSWFRLESMVKYLKDEIEDITLHHSQNFISYEVETDQILRFLSSLIPLKSWVIFNPQTGKKTGSGELLRHQSPPGSLFYFSVGGSVLWRKIDDRQIIGLEWQDDKKATQEQLALLESMLLTDHRTAHRYRPVTNEAVQNEIGKLKSLSRQLNDLRQIMDSGLSNMADGLLVISTYGQIMVINRPACQILDVDRKQAWVNTPALPLLSAIRLDNAVSWESLLGRCLIDQKESSAAGLNANEIDIFVHVAPIINSQSTIEALVLTLSDVSELKNNERKRAEVLSFLSHDLRSPLVSILALVETANRQTNKSDNQPLFDKIESYAESTLDMSEQFVELIRADVLQPQNLSEFDLSILAMNAIEQLWEHAQHKQITIHQIDQQDDNEILMLGDADMIERALVNLISNAIKYSEEKTSIEVLVSETDGMASCQIRDQGIGIPPESLPNLFDLYHRVKIPGQERPKGSGLGLAFVKTVAEKHGGKVEVESVPGKGSIFTLYLPRNNKTLVE